MDKKNKIIIIVVVILLVIIGVIYLIFNKNNNVDPSTEQLKKLMLTVPEYVDGMESIEYSKDDIIVTISKSASIYLTYTKVPDIKESINLIKSNESILNVSSDNRVTFNDTGTTTLYITNKKGNIKSNTVKFIVTE